MALTISQVNQGFLALFGRPATGAEATKFASQADVAALADTLLKDKAYEAQLSAPIPSFKKIDLAAATDDAFVESAYQALIGRASDAEGKTYWLGVLSTGVSRDELVDQMIANLTAQAADGTADGLAFQTIVDEDKAASAEWVESLYQNIVARASDAEGLNYWSDLLIQGATGGQVVAAFIAAAAAQGATTEDGQNFAKKQAFADAFTNAFKDFNNAITANEKALVLGNLKTLMDGVNKDSQEDQYTEEIIKIVNEYQDIKAVQFTKADDDDLGIDPETGESNLTSAANFTGTYNLTDETKGTIQSTDSATGTEAYLSDTLTVNVTGYDKTTHNEFDLGNLPNTSSVEKLTINNGAASVTGDINADFEYINVNGTGSFNITNATTSNPEGFKDIVLNSGSKKVNVFETTQNVTSIKTGAGDDNITIGTTDANGIFHGSIVAKSISTGAGDDVVKAALGANATAELGAGNDSFSGSLSKGSSVNAGAGDDAIAIFAAAPEWNKDNTKFTSSMKVDGGTGTDTLDLSRGVTSTGAEQTEFRGIESIRGIEKLTVGTGTTLAATAVSGQKLELSGTSMTLDARGATSVDLSKFTNAKDEDVQVNIANVKTGTINLAAGNKDFNLIKETISLTNDASKVSVKGFEKGNDHVAIAGATANDAALFTKVGTADRIDTSVVAKDNVYFVNLDHKLTKAGLNDALNGAKFNLAEKDVFYIVATDSTEVGGNGKNSTAKIYKVEVGKDKTVAKIDQVATVNVADKAQLSYDDFVNSITPAPVITKVQVDVSTHTVAADGTLDLSDIKEMTDDTKAYGIDLSTIANASNITKIILPNGIVASSVNVFAIANPANKPAGTVEIVIPSDAKISAVFQTGLEYVNGKYVDDKVKYNVTVQEGAQVQRIDTNDAENMIKVANGTATVFGQDSNDIIDITAATKGEVKYVNGGLGDDTLVISGDAAANLETMLRVERIEFTGTSINSDAIVTNAKGIDPDGNLVSGAAVPALEIAQMKSAGIEELTIIAGKKDVDLSSLVQATDDSGDASLKITGVKDNSNVTLTTSKDAAHTFAETVALAAATGVTVNNIQANDTVTSDNFAGFSGSFTDLGTGSLTDKGLFFTSVGTLGQTAQEVANAAAAKLTTGKAILAVNTGSTQTGNSELFIVENGVATLVVKTDNIINEKDAVANGTVTFDDGIVPVPVPTDAYDYVKDLTNTTITVGTTKDIKDQVINFKEDGSLSVINIDGALTVRASDATAANNINLVMASYNTAIADTNIQSEEAANTTLTLAKDTAVTGTSNLKNIDTLVINGNTTLNAASIKSLATSAATISQTSQTDTITVTEKASFEGIKGSANINAVITGANEFAVTKGTTYTGQVNAILGSDQTGGNTVTLANKATLAGVDSITAAADLTTLNVSYEVLKALPAGVKIDLGKATVAVTITGLEAAKPVDLSAWFVNASDDTFTQTAALAAAVTFVGTDGNDTFNFSGAANITSIDGGAGEDTITINGGTKLSSITNVEKITIDNSSAAVALNAAALNGSKAEVTVSGATNVGNTVTLDAKSASGLVDLSGITKAGTNDGIIISNVNASTTLKLSDFQEKVQFAKLGGDVNLGKMVSNAGSGDTVEIELATSATKVTGSDAADTIKLTADATYSNLSSIALETTDTVQLQGNVTLNKATALDGNSFILDGSATNQVLTVKAANGIDLSGMKLAQTPTNKPSIVISDVVDGTVKLSTYDTSTTTNNFTETVKLAAKAEGVVITGLSKQAIADKVDTSNFTITDQVDALTDGVAVNKIYKGKDMDTAAKLFAALPESKTIEAGAYILTNTTAADTTYKLYVVTDAIYNDASAALDKTGAIKLIATLTGETNNAGWASDAITFA